ncbi:MAG: ammonium transporter [Bacillota bacterium]
MSKKWINLMRTGLLGVLFWVLAGIAVADTGDITAGEIAFAVDTLWTLLAGFMVFFMHAGFTMVETGFTRAKNAVNIIMKNILTISSGVIIFYAIGFAIAFGPSLGGFIGTKGFGLIGLEGADFGVPLTGFWFFQAVFAATAATIVSGAVAERTKFSAYLLFTVIITSITYPVVVHWVWGGGWLSELGFVDFAGSTVVHSVGGWSALVGAALVGARIGKYGTKGEVKAIPGHNIPFGALGVLILWFGWFGFNCGSTLSGTDEAISSIAATTILSASAATVSAMAITWLRYGKPDISLTLNGALGGLVGITAGAASVTLGGSLLVGLFSGALLVLAVEFIDQKLKIDDPVGAISVHGVCGAFGTLAVGLFSSEAGLFYGGGTSLLAIQAAGVFAVGIWVILISFLAFKLIGWVVGLRVSPEEEIEGLDVGEHGISAYGNLAGKTGHPIGEAIVANTPISI